MCKKRRSILFIIPSLSQGGAERVIVTLLRNLDQHQFKMVLAVVDMRGGVLHEEVPDDVEFIDLACSRVRYAIPKIIHLIWQRRPDVVFSTLGHLNLALAVMRPFLPSGVKYIAREASIVSETLKSETPSFLWRFMYRFFYGRFDLLVCQSFAMQRDLIENFALEKKRMVVIHNPVDVQHIQYLSKIGRFTEPLRDRLSPEGEIISLVTAGRFSAEKGFDLLIEAIALCNDHRVQLTLLGDGPLRRELELLTCKLGLEGRVRFVGYQKNPFPFFAQADAYVLSSRHEGFPNVVLEALACGTPVIATPAIGGVTEILNDLEGCMQARGISAVALSHAIQEFHYGRRISPSVLDPYAVKVIVERYAKEFISDVSI